jgi:hypothetical protein
MLVLSYRPEVGRMFGKNDSLVPLAETVALAKLHL